MAKFGPKMASRNVFRTLQIKTHFRHSRFSFYHRPGSSVTHMGTRLRRALYGDASQVHNFFQKCKIVASRCLFPGRFCSRISGGGGDVQLGGRGVFSPTPTPPEVPELSPPPLFLYHNSPDLVSDCRFSA